MGVGAAKVTVLLPQALRHDFGLKGPVAVSGATLGEALQDLDRRRAGLAVSLLERQPVAGLPDWIAAWSETAEDPHLLERLAAGPERRIWRDDPDLFWSTAAADLVSDGPATTVALLALEKIVPDLNPDDLPRVFEVLEAAPVPPAGEAWRAYLEVVRVAARRSPHETARFLVDAIEHARPGATRSARQTLGDFPPRQREALRQALRLSESIGPPRAR